MTDKTLSKDEELLNFLKTFTDRGVQAFLNEVGFDEFETAEETNAMTEALAIFGQYLLFNYMKAISVENKDSD